MDANQLKAVGLVCLVIAWAIAAFQGINGMVFTGVVSVIAAICGIEIGIDLGKKKNGGDYYGRPAAAAIGTE